MIKVLFICHGNICRSTMAECVMTYLVEKEGLADKFYINSAATSREEIGNGVHHGTVAKLKKEGIPVIPHRAVQMTLNDYEEYDYLIGMDTENIRNMQRISGGDPDEKVYKLLTFAGSGLDVADPWYTGDFEATYRDVLAGCKGLLECLKEELQPTTHLPWQNIHIPLVRAEYSGSCLKLCTETAERRIAGDVVRVGYGEDCVNAAVARN